MSLSAFSLYTTDYRSLVISSDSDSLCLESCLLAKRALDAREIGAFVTVRTASSATDGLDEVRPGTSSSCLPCKE